VTPSTSQALSTPPVLRQDHSRQWELFGQKDPYYGVLTHEQFKRDALGDEGRRRFFASGDEQFDDLPCKVARRSGLQRRASA
jgi:hypothetical protein